MKILFTTSFYPPFHVGGACTHVKYLAEALVSEGHEVHVMFSMDAYELKRHGVQRMPKNWNGVKVHTLKSPLGKLEPILNYVLGTQKYTYNYFMNLVQKEKFDVVHHHNISLLGYNILKKLGNYKNMYTAHDYWLICHKYNYSKFGKICNRRTCFSCTLAHAKPYLFHRLGNEFKTAIKDIDLIIAPSNFMRNELKKYLKNKIEVIYNFVPEPPRNLPKIAYEDYYLFVGQLENHKSILELIELFMKNKKQLLIIGKGSLEEQIRKRITTSSNIKYLGWKNNIQILTFMKNANALILPSEWAENMPNVVLEAMSVGCPFICSDMGGLKELAKLTCSGLMFPTKDLNKLNSILKKFRNQEYSKQKLLKTYCEFFHKKAFLKKYYHLIK